MDYSIGSVADLISGTNTANKPAVIRKPLKIQYPNVKVEVNEENPRETKQPPFNRQNEGTQGRKRKLHAVDDLQQSRKRPKPWPKPASDIGHGILQPVTYQMSAEEAAKTVFVGNIPVTITKKQLKRQFSKFGPVVSTRLRCPTPADPKKSKRLTVITKQFNQKRTTLHCYIKYADEESATKATAANGSKYKGHFIRVQLCSDTTPPDVRKGIFVGNVPFDAEDDELWNAFAVCGPIVSVRLVRDQATGMGKGIGYVNFESADAVELALEMDELTIRKKVLRIKRLQRNPKKSRAPAAAAVPVVATPKKIKPKSEIVGGDEKMVNPVKPPNKSIPIKKSLFQGTTAKNSKKKKFKKLSKEAIKKLKISKILANK